MLPLAEVRIDDSCGTKIAFAMGMAAHGLGDQVWDSLFEPQLQERGEDLESSPAYTADAFPPGADSSVGDALRAVVGDEPFDLLASGFGSADLEGETSPGRVGKALGAARAIGGGAVSLVGSILTRERGSPGKSHA